MLKHADKRWKQQPKFSKKNPEEINKADFKNYYSKKSKIGIKNHAGI